jgi:hypothetical protein
MTQENNTSENDQARLIERPDGFYWQDIATGKLYGPFSTLAEAKEDILYRDDSNYEEGETLQEAEDEIGIADWIDPENAGPAESLSPRFSDDE